jgi:hypothetical protein
VLSDRTGQESVLLTHHKERVKTFQVHLLTSYFTVMVVGWWSTRISPSNSHVATGFSAGETITMPLRMAERFTFFKANEHVWLDRTS